MALQADYRLDCGAYADTAPRMTAAIATGTGEPYALDNIECDAYCIYTNHIYATSFRGFGHEVSVFCMERMIDKLARALGMDGAEVRRINLWAPGGTSPTQVPLTLSNAGNPQACLAKAAEMIQWRQGPCLPVGGNKVRARGLACFSKTSSSPTDASSGAVLMFCPDGSVNLNCGVVECGQGFHTVIRQILAQRLKMDPARVFVQAEPDTRTSPAHWKTVASMSTYLAGNAVLQAADDAIGQLKRAASVVLRCREHDLEVGEERVWLTSDPSIFVAVKDLVGGIKYENGNAFGGQIIGRGSYVMEHLTTLDKETGRGRTGPYWTVGAQAVEIEYDTRECTFRLLHAVTAIDAGRVLNPRLARGQVTGAMNMGLSVATREGFVYNDNAQMQHSSLRTYKVIHFAENPRYDVAFVETPNITGPYGARGLGEHGILGMPPALANALAAASGTDVDDLPIKFEKLWALAGGKGGPS
jgi:CO/xanthine dehydrogenase Mo-binding subunit